MICARPSTTPAHDSGDNFLHVSLGQKGVLQLIYTYSFENFVMFLPLAGCVTHILFSIHTTFCSHSLFSPVRTVACLRYCRWCYLFCSHSSITTSLALWIFGFPDMWQSGVTSWRRWTLQRLFVLHMGRPVSLCRFSVVLVP